LQRDVGIDVKIGRPSIAELCPAPLRTERRTTDTASLRAERRMGTVTFFHDRRGYGFIDVGSEQDVFVHHTNTSGGIATGQEVELAIRQGRKGLEAYDVVAPAPVG
jgi:cold shock protein